MIRKLVRIWAWCFVGGGLLMGYFGFSAVGDSLAAWLFDESVEGVVIGHDTSTANRGRRTHVAPVVRFTAEDGQTVTFTDAMQDRASSDYAIGERVSVRYDADEPDQASIASTTLWTGGAGMIGIVFGVILTLTGLLVLLLAKLPWQANKG
ncbi:DUF3592 domain-containing protein [Pseudomonas borbori]